MFVAVPRLLQPLVILLLALTFSWLMALIHELGHVMVGALFGGKCKIAWRKGGFAPTLTTHVTFTTPLRPWKNALFTMAGILNQLAVSVLFMLQPLFPEVRMLTLIYLAVIVVNIIPVRPSDGYYLHLLIKQWWVQQYAAFVRTLTGLQWMAFLLALSVTAWYSIQMLLWSVHTGSLEWLGLGVIGCIVIVRMILAVWHLLATPALVLKEGGRIHD